jgi:acyl transferase domain-containing protein/NADPH:quinone reductase-like Zn-dependent oxidoreductase/NAD(P)-dependent dehydrogenase (short-subunit alcohol dehydrogenase family)/acyl carrier protein
MNSRPENNPQVRDAIAITGIGCRYPGGGNSPEAFWNLLRNGVDAVTEIPPDRWNIPAYFEAKQGLPGKTYSRWGGFIEGIDQFDPGFFGISPREAAFMDPQQRLLLETAWESLEDAGQVVDSEAGSNTGVFVGISTHDYSQMQAVPTDKTTIEPHTTTGSVMSIAANRISYLFNFRGPSFIVDTACSSSLVAVHLACRSLWNGECATALAAGVNVILIEDTYIGFSQMSMLSPDGRCKAFDARGNGFVRGEGAGVVVLKPLAAAKADGDRIYAVIRGSAVNQDGRTSSLTVPSVEAQERLILSACRDGGVEPREIYFIEAHGTGTPVGDPIETCAIGAAIGQGRNGQACLIGSVKTNIGHLEAGSGIAGLIKTALVLHHGEVPPNLHFEQPNPDIDFEKWKLRVPVAVEKIPAENALAGINSFGFGGTNAHVILQRAVQPPATGDPDQPLLFTLSARDAEGLRAAAGNYCQWLGTSKEPFRDICHTLAARRKHHMHRLAIAAETKGEVIEKLEAFLAGEARPGLSSGSASASNKLALVFTGQGPQWWAMGRELLAGDRIFRDKIEECDALFLQFGKWSLIEELSRDEAASRMGDTEIAQPSIFALQVALAAWWHARGIVPAAVTGHSVGEAASAHLSGALDLATAAKVIFHRGRCMQMVPPTGKMLAVALSPEAARPYLAGFEGRAEIGAVNSPRSITVSGQPDALEQIAKILDTENIWSRFLRVNYAFHSAQMDPIESELKGSLRGIKSGAITTPVYSSVDGTLAAGEGKFDAEYWWRNVRQPVKFAAAIDALIGDGYTAFLEIGPHPALSGSISECLNARATDGFVVGSLRRAEPDRGTLLNSLGMLHVRGIKTRWIDTGRCVTLPAYPWQRERCWHEAEESKTTRLNPPIHPLLGRAMNTADPVWELKVNRALLPYLEDHQLNGRVVFPAAAYVEMALAAGHEIHPSAPLIVEDIEFRRALFLSETERATKLEIGCSAGEGLFHIASQADNAERSWTTHCAGKIRAGSNTAAPRAVPVDEIMKRCTEEKSGAESYELFRRNGFDFGESFRGIVRVWRRDGEALGEIHATEKLKLVDYLIHPAMLDACFQVLLSTLTRDESARGLFLPVRIDRMKFYARPGGTIRSHVRLLESSDKAIVASLRLLGEDGSMVAEIEGFRCAALDQGRRETQEMNDCFYEIQWREKERESKLQSVVKGSWLFIGDTQPVASEALTVLKMAGEKCETVPRVAELDARLAPGASIGRVIYLAHSNGADPAVKANRLCDEVLQIVRKLTARGMNPQLSIVTQGAQPAGMDGKPPAIAQSPLLGLTRVAMNEHVELHCRLIDLSLSPSSVEIRSLIDELRTNAVEEEVALREAARYVPRLSRLAVKPKCTKGADTPFRLEVVKPGVLDNVEFCAIERRPPQAGEVEIKVRAAGLNFRDVMKVLGIYPIEQPIDQLLGDECAGRVTAVGAGVTRFREGDEVIAISPACFSSFLTVNAAFVVRKPEHLLFEEAVTIPVTFLTADYALRHLARIARGERVLIHAAAGGVGIAALQIARLAGAEIFATAGSDDKRALARSFGAAHVMDSRSLDFAEQVMTITGGRGVDIVLNSLAGEAIQQSLAILAPYGRFLEIGKRDIYQNSRIGLRPFRKNLSLFAIDLSQLLRDRPAFIESALDELMRQFETRDLVPLPVKTYPISRAADAFREMAQGRHSGKIVFSFDDADVAVRPPQGGQISFSPGATYLVSGGVRGFGLAIAEWMIERGARHMVLLGASDASAGAARKQLARHEANDVQILTAAVDVSSGAALAKFLSGIRETMPPLRGIIHAAVKMDDGILQQMNAERFWNVIGPKAGGAWNLHEQTRELPLDFFVMISSISSIIGNPGQGNYAAANAFLDSLAHYRGALGLPALTINWGHLGNVGYAARHANVSEHLNRHGVLAIELQEALAMLGRLLRSDTAQAAAMRMDWDRWAEANPRIKKSPRYSEIVSFEAPEQGSGRERPAAAILCAAEEERQKLLEKFVQEQAALVLRTSPAKLDPSRPLNELGLDSLMAIELMNRIEDGLGRQVPTDNLAGVPSIVMLATILNESISGSEAAPASAAAVAPDGQPASVSTASTEIQTSNTAEVRTPKKKGILGRIKDSVSDRK